MNNRRVYLRLTHRYVDECRELDRHQYLFDVKLTPPRMVREPTDFDDGGDYVRYATLPAGLTRAQRRQGREALAETLSKWGCTHDYDCCGCELVRTRAFPTDDPRRVRLVSHIGYNF